MHADAATRMIRPLRDGSHVQTIPQGCFGRIKKKRGARQLIFAPGLFFKIGRSKAETTNIERECAALQEATRYNFWEPLTGRVYRIPSYGFVGRRFRPATPGDFDRLYETVDGLFEEAMVYPEIEAADGVERRPLARHLSRAERATLLGLLRGLQLPRTAMHGDLQLFNFVFAGDAPRLIDWEFFDPRGSFVYDYLDFFISITAINTDDSWHTIMRRLNPAHPAVARVAARLEVSPRALLAYYLYVKVNTILSLGGSFTRVSDTFFDDLIAGLRRTLAAA